MYTCMYIHAYIYIINKVELILHPLRHFISLYQIIYSIISAKAVFCFYYILYNIKIYCPRIVTSTINCPCRVTSTKRCPCITISTICCPRIVTSTIYIVLI